MAGFDIDLTTDITDRLATWAEQYISETSFRRYRRACAFVMDETAKHVAFNTAQVSFKSTPDRLYREKSGYPPELTAKWRESAQGVCRDGLDAAASAVEKAMADMLDLDDEPA